MTIAAMLLVLSAAAGAPADAKSVLFLGNSYSAGTAHYITEVFKHEAPQFELTFVCPGGAVLGHHLKDEKSLGAIASKQWDFVVLQGQSQAPALPGGPSENFHRAVAELSEMLRTKGDPTILLYLTWGRQHGDLRNPEIYPDFETMLAKISEQYVIAARKNKLAIAPVGHAFSVVRQNNPALFDRLYKQDGSHPSALAGYLAGCVFYQQFPASGRFEAASSVARGGGRVGGARGEHAANMERMGGPPRDGAAPAQRPQFDHAAIARAESPPEGFP